MDRTGAGDYKERGKIGDSALEAGWHDTADSEPWESGPDETLPERQTGYPDRGERWPDLTGCEAGVEREREILIELKKSQVRKSIHPIFFHYIFLFIYKIHLW